jgi:hypothetical protein
MMSRQRLERRRAAEQRWPLLANLMACHFNEDFDVLYGSLEGALAAAAGDGPLEHRRAILKEWRDWNSTAGAVLDIRPLLKDAFAVAVRFRKPIDARNFMNRVYDELIGGVRAETR